MSTSTNGAATEVATTSATRATASAGKAVVTVADSLDPSLESAGGRARDAGQAWIDASKTVAGLSLDAYDAGIKAYLEYTRNVVAAGRADWAIELAENNTKIISDLAANYSSAARDLLNT